MENEKPAIIFSIPDRSLPHSEVWSSVRGGRRIFFLFRIVVYHSLRVVIGLGRDLMSNLAYAVDCNILVGTHNDSPRSCTLASSIECAAVIDPNYRYFLIDVVDLIP